MLSHVDQQMLSVHKSKRWQFYKLECTCYKIMSNNSTLFPNMSFFIGSTNEVRFYLHGNILGVLLIVNKKTRVFVHQKSGFMSVQGSFFPPKQHCIKWLRSDGSLCCVMGAWALQLIFLCFLIIWTGNTIRLFRGWH